MPRVDAADDHQNQQQPPDAFAQGLEHLAEAGPGHARVVALPGDEPGDEHQQRGQHQAGDDAGDEEATDGGVGGDRVDDHDDRRRDQDPQGPGGADDADAELHRVALLDHGRQQDRTDRHHRGRAGAGDRGKQGAGDDAAEGQAAAQVTDQGGGEADHALGHPAMGEEVAGQDEERDRHDLELLDAGEELHRHRLHRDLGHGEEEGEDGQAEGDGDRHAGEHEDGQQAEDNGAAHLWPPV